MRTPFSGSRPACTRYTHHASASAISTTAAARIATRPAERRANAGFSGGASSDIGTIIVGLEPPQTRKMRATPRITRYVFKSDDLRARGGRSTGPVPNKRLFSKRLGPSQNNTTLALLGRRLP